MLDKLRSMAVFVRVAETGSFRRAAERLGLSASVVSHHVSLLENELGVQLLYRSTRHVALTDRGQRFYESCRSMVLSAEGALAELHEDQLSGKLWVVAPAPFSVGPFMRDIAEFCRLYPKVDLRLEFDDGPRNLIQEGIDVAISLTQPTNSSLICRTLFSNTHGLYAAPSYLAQCGPLNQFADLARLEWINVLSMQDLVLRQRSGQEVRITPHARVCVNNVAAQHELVLAGVGVARMPQVAVEADLAAGRLVRILPEWQSEQINCCAVYPARTRPNSLARQFVDFIYEKLNTLGDKQAPAP